MHFTIIVIVLDNHFVLNCHNNHIWVNEKGSYYPPFLQHLFEIRLNISE
jgi:hypothetical protein